MEISVSLQFPRENCPFPINFHEKTMGKFRCFLMCIEKKRLFSEEVYAQEDESCVICLERECQPAMKMCPSCENIFHSHCIAGWLIEFMNRTCPHCRMGLSHRMLEDVEVVLPLRVLHTSSTQTVNQTLPAMWNEHDYSSSLSRFSLPESGTARSAIDSGEHSPVSPVWSPVSPYANHTPSITVSPVITVRITPESVVSTPLLASPPNPTLSSGEIPKSPLPPTLGNTVTSSAPLAFSVNPHASTADNESPRNVWSFIAEQLRREGWQTNSALPSFNRTFETQ